MASPPWKKTMAEKQLSTAAIEPDHQPADNPFRRSLTQRLAARGGQYRSPGVRDDRIIMAEEDAVAMAREAVALRDTLEVPF